VIICIVAGGRGCGGEGKVLIIEENVARHIDVASGTIIIAVAFVIGGVTEEDAW
jgi:hypothetical protein